MHGAGLLSRRHHPYFDLQPQDGAQLSLASALVQAQGSQRQSVQAQPAAGRFSTFVMMISWVWVVTDERISKVCTMVRSQAWPR
jgi:hypothetical protein